VPGLLSNSVGTCTLNMVGWQLSRSAADVDKVPKIAHALLGDGG
jgi:hypothetical protein